MRGDFATKRSFGATSRGAAGELLRYNKLHVEARRPGDSLLLDTAVAGLVLFLCAGFRVVLPLPARTRDVPRKHAFRGVSVRGELPVAAGLPRVDERGAAVAVARAAGIPVVTAGRNRLRTGRGRSDAGHSRF